MNISRILDLVSRAGVRDIVVQFIECEAVVVLAWPDVQDAAGDVTGG
jgi:hypothetical protein